MISQLLNRSLEIPLFLNRFRKRFGIPVYLRLKSTSFVQKRMPEKSASFFLFGAFRRRNNPRFYRGKKLSHEAFRRKANT